MKIKKKNSNDQELQRKKRMSMASTVQNEREEQQDKLSEVVKRLQNIDTYKDDGGTNKPEDLTIRDWIVKNDSVQPFKIRKNGLSFLFEKGYDYCSITIRKNLKSPIEKELIGEVGSVLVISTNQSNEEILNILKMEYDIEID